MHQSHRLIRHSSVIALLVVLLAARPSHAQHEEMLAKIDALAAEALKHPASVGFSIAIGVGDEIVLADGYGLAEVEHNAPARPDTMFRIGSVTKQYTAAAIMKLVEEGKLDLEEPMSTFFPDYPLGDRTVTIRHLLTHTSGIKSYTEVRQFWTEGLTRELTVEELLSYVRDKPFDFEPGEQYAYNNTAYYMLGPIIEQVSGMPYDEYLQAAFFGPLELEHTRYDSNSDIIPGRAQGYGVFNGELRNDRLIGMANPGAAGGLIASAKDLVKWQMALVNGEVVSAESYEQMATPFTLNDGTQTSYGFGLGIGEFEGRPMISHGGGIAGFSAKLVYFPEEKMHVAIISNSEATNTGEIAWEVQRAALGLGDVEAADLEIPPELLTQLSGTYFIERFNVRPQVVARDGRLYFQPQTGSEFRLMYQGGNEFFAEPDPRIRVVFEIGHGDEPARKLVLHRAGGEYVGIREAP